MSRNIVYIVALTLSLFITATSAVANQDIGEMRAQRLFSIVRCAVCNGQSIAESEAGIAIALRKAIRHQILNGKTDEEILLYLEQRYGEAITTRLRWGYQSIALWVLPALMLLSLLYLALRGCTLHKTISFK